MALVTADTFKLAILDWILNRDMLVHLDTAGVVPDGSTDLAAFFEPTDPGYAPLPLHHGDWTQILNLHVAEAKSKVLTFVFDGEVAITGYFVTAGGALLFSENLAGGSPLEVIGGQAFNLTLTYQDGDCF